MAPALTEPLSPAENLTSAAVTTSGPPNTRSNRKLEPTIGNQSNSIAKKLSLKSTPPIREKPNHSKEINQIPTSSRRSLCRRSSVQRISKPFTSFKAYNTPEVKSPAARKISKLNHLQEDDRSVSSVINTISLDTNNEQMGLNTAPLTSKNNILCDDTSKSNTNDNLDTIDDCAKDSSTAQLLADLTNEAITAEICLRNQLKDVNLVKSSGDPSSPIIQQDTFDDTQSDIIVLKPESPTKAIAPELNITTIAHMEAQFDDSKSSNISTTKESKDPEQATSIPAKNTVTRKQDEDSVKAEETEEKEVVASNIKENPNEPKKDEPTRTTETYLESATDGSSHLLDDASETKKIVPKFDVLSLQELPPVSTDSTMTASEVEDNIEERLSQLDGTAIDSPPPNNHDIDSSEKSIQNSDADTARPHTPINQQTFCNEIQELQKQLEQSPPTAVTQQVQSHSLQQPQQANCFTIPQSANLVSVASGNIPHSDNVSGTAELEDQDIEEVFKVLKGFEGGTPSDLNVCDLNVLFNEVYMKINETEIGGNAGSVGSLAGAISTNTPSHVPVMNPSIQLVKPTKMEESQIEIEKRQQQMQRKTDFLLRRLRKLQVRYMCKHTSEEIAGLFEWTARQVSKGVTNTTCLQQHDSTDSQNTSKSFLKVIAARPPASDWRGVHETLVPASQMTSLLRKIESVANAQQLCMTPSASLVSTTHKKTKKSLVEAHAATSSSTISSTPFTDGKADEVVVATLDENITDELSQVSGLLQIAMSEVQKAVDSDATESSSGGESADEMVTYNNTQQHTLPITKRAAWRYSRDRAAIASRWSWLLSQISDLEIKIRQHSELHQEILRSKGVVTCESQIGTAEDQVNEELSGSCRTRGYIPSVFRKRKLIQTTNIHTISKKVARPSTIKCGCQWPLHPCALCTGRVDPTAPRDLPDTMMMSDRIALLDSGYHPVLSFKENINNALHFEAIAKQTEWQQRVMRCQAKNIAKNVWRAEREAAAATPSSKKYSESSAKRRYVKKKDRPSNEEKQGLKSSNSIRSTQQHAATIISPSAVTSFAASLASTTSSSDVGNGTATLSTTTSTTPLVANRGAIGVKKQHSPIVREEVIKDCSNSPVAPKRLSTTSLTLTTSSPATTTPYKVYMHQTSDCLPTNYNQFNPNQIPSSLISNNHNHNSSKSSKIRKPSSSAVVYSHHYNHPNNCTSNQFNCETNNMFSNEYWGGIGENYNVRSRTSSPTHGSSGIIYHKYERSLDRKNRTSYDIDNIVIPYSVAAATRVEVLPYKEIPTPKWRLIDNENVEMNDINKTQISQYQESGIETLLDAKPVRNGHVCDSKLMESKKIISKDNKKPHDEHLTFVQKKGIQDEKCNSHKSKENHIIKIEKAEKADVKDLQYNTKENGFCLLSDTNAGEKHFEEEYSNSQKYSSFVKNCKESEFQELKIGSNTICDTKYNSENRKTEQCNEEKMENGLKLGIEENEDISDDALFLKHERALIEERRKFQTYLKFPWSTRSRANRRIDSRAESSGANTPDPSSPAPQTPSMGGGDLESIPSPLNPATPLNPLDTTSETGDNTSSFLGVNSLPSLSSKRYERRRTNSSKRDREIERRSSTPDSKELIPPYEPLTFPLTDEQFEELMSAMPSEHGEDCKRFDECYLPGGSGGIIGLGINATNKYPRNVSASTSKRSSRASTLCGEGGTAIANRHAKISNSKNYRLISSNDSNADDMLLYDDDYEDDYPKHYLAPNDDHLTADSADVRNFTTCDGLYIDDDDYIYGDQYGAYVGRQQRKRRADSEVDTSEEEPYQDDDPNDPEWRGETEERMRRKV